MMHLFHIDAMVILPDRLHRVWTLPEGDADYPTRLALIKSGFSRVKPKEERRSASRITKGERGIWQRRYWEHINPRRQGLCAACGLCALEPRETRLRVTGR